jgi:uridine phosphorylase
MSKPISNHELIVNEDGSIFHLHLKPGMVSDTVILVGDQKRVGRITKFFDNIEHKVQNREFCTHIGTYKGKRLTVISSGIGTDNIDIVMNELDALVNVDFETRTIKEEKTKLNIIRVGTCGGLQAESGIDVPVVSKFGVGFDNVLHFYRDRKMVCELDMEKKFMEHTKWNENLSKPYIVKCSDKLFEIVGKDINPGMTISCSGFYAPSGKKIRLDIVDPELNAKIKSFDYNGNKVMNCEMECSVIYGLSRLLGHDALVVCQVVDNYVTDEFSQNYREHMGKFFVRILDRLCNV